jgi:hypothetical protein
VGSKKEEEEGLNSLIMRSLVQIKEVVREDVSMQASSMDNGNEDWSQMMPHHFVSGGNV